jgi:hypothetical protein
MKNPPAARGQGEKAAQKNAEIFHGEAARMLKM